MGGGAVGKHMMELQRLSETRNRAGNARSGSAAALRQVVQEQSIKRCLKRAGDLIGASIGLVLCLPIFLVIALAIRIDSPGPVLFRHRRMGRRRRPFHVLKFRTMVDEAENLGPEVTIATDRRITRVGAFLRRTKLDELPQLWNVLVGEMSLVGPRPQSFSFLPYYSDEDLAVILSVRPGITGPTQLWLRNEEEILARQDDPIRFYVLTLLPAKIASDRQYVQTWSLRTDLRILARTLCALLRIGPTSRAQLEERAAVLTEGTAGAPASARVYEKVV
jgi:lipopolysaccharide/colanic/teichoic acid biosynthesis glycosyltransferase